MAKASENLVEKVFDLLVETEQPLLVAEVASSVGVHKTVAGDALRELVKRGVAEREVGQSVKGHPPYLYTAAGSGVTRSEDDAQAEPAESIRFRGKSASRAAYILVTGSTYGLGSHPSAEAIVNHPSMRRFNEENRFNAIGKLVELGVLQHVGQVNKAPGRAHRKYEVLLERDPNFDVKSKSPKRTKKRAAAKAAPATSSSLEQRVADLEQQVGSLLAALRAV